MGVVGRPPAATIEHQSMVEAGLLERVREMAHESARGLHELAFP
jgi:hypothetical protein